MIDTMETNKISEKNLTLREHLIELRQRLIKSVIVVAVTTGISFIFAGRIFDFFQSRAPEDTVFIVIELQEKMSVYMQISIYSGIVLALPFLIYQLVMFIRPALTTNEKKYLYTLLPGIILFFFAGAVFTYYIFLPPALDFLINFPSDRCRRPDQNRSLHFHDCQNAPCHGPSIRTTHYYLFLHQDRHS